MILTNTVCIWLMKMIIRKEIILNLNFVWYSVSSVRFCCSEAVRPCCIKMEIKVINLFSCQKANAKFALHPRGNKTLEFRFSAQLVPVLCARNFANISQKLSDCSLKTVGEKEREINSQKKEKNHIRFFQSLFSILLLSQICQSQKIVHNFQCQSVCPQYVSLSNTKTLKP